MQREGKGSIPHPMGSNNGLSSFKNVGNQSVVVHSGEAM